MKKFGVVLFWFATVLVAAAQTNPAPVVRAMSLSDCIQEAVAHNLDLQIQRYNPQLSLFNLNSAYGGYDPTFSFSGQHQYNNSGAEFQNGQHVAGSDYNSDTFGSALHGAAPWGMTYTLGGNVQSTKGANNGNVGGTNISIPFQNSSGQIGAITLTQPLLKNFWIDNTRLTIRINKNRLKFSEQGVRGQLISSITAVENAYYELIFAQEFVKVQQEALDLSQTQLNQDQQRVQIGSLAQLDVQQDEAQVAKNKASLISAVSTLGTDQRILKNLLTDEYSKWYESNIQPTSTLEAPLQLFDLQDSWNKGMTLRPDLLQARLNVEAQGIQLKFDKNQLFPELDLIGSYGYNGSGGSFDDTFDQFNKADRSFYTYGAQISMPLSNMGPRNQFKAGKVTLKQLLLQLKQLEQNVMVLIDNSVGVAKSDYESVQATRQSRIYAEAALDAEQKKYAVGKSTTFTVLDLQNKLTAARSDEIRALADYNKSLANLASEEGSTLERNNIKLETK
jgi:outer membrane protein TolC